MPVAIKNTAVKNQILKRFLRSLGKRVPKSRFLWAMSSFFTGRSLYHQLGWFKSAWRAEAIDAAGEPIPWMTYAVIDFLTKKCDKKSKLKVWEFGSGNSTLWWAERAASVTAVEHDRQWYEQVKSKLKHHKNATIIFSELSEKYPDTILKSKGQYDIVVVDGRMRIECATNAIKRLGPSGVIIWDNSDDKKYKSGIDFLVKKGFRTIDFIGPEPIGNYLVQTTVFYRPQNVLGI